MPLNLAKATAVLDALRTLTSDDATPYTATMTGNLLNADQHRNVDALYQRLQIERLQPRPRSRSQSSQRVVLDTREQEHQQDTPDSSILSLSDSPLRRKVGRPSKHPKLDNINNDGGLFSSSSSSSSSAWLSLRDLRAIELDPDIAGLITVEEEDAVLAAFFGDGNEPNFPPQQATLNWQGVAKFCQSLNNRHPHPPPRTTTAATTTATTTAITATATATATTATTTTIGSVALETVHWLFDALALGDMIVQIHGKDRLNRTMRDVAWEVAANTTTALSQESFKEMLAIASNISFICETIHTGSLFWLWSFFSPHFLANKITRTGLAYDEMMANFAERGHARTIENSGANRAGDAVRLYLRRRYKIDGGRRVD